MKPTVDRVSFLILFLCLSVKSCIRPERKHIRDGTSAGWVADMLCLGQLRLPHADTPSVQRSNGTNSDSHDRLGFVSCVFFHQLSIVVFAFGTCLMSGSCPLVSQKGSFCSIIRALSSCKTSRSVCLIVKCFINNWQTEIYVKSAVGFRIVFI